MKLKIPPVLTTLIATLLMWWIAKLFAGTGLTFQVSIWLPIFCVALALAIGLLGVVQFSVHKTTVNPHKPEKSSSLVNDGIYKHTRNPMYLALLVLLIAIGFYLGSVPSFLVAPLFIWFMNKYQIEPEEQMLIQNFGTDYKKYQEEVRRWI